MVFPIKNIYDYLLLSRIGDRPVSAEEVMDHLKMDRTLLDDADFRVSVETMIDAAIIAGEKITKRVLWQANFKAFLDCFLQNTRPVSMFGNVTNENSYEIRKAPLISITSISRYVSGVLTPIDSAEYYATQSNDFSLVSMVSGLQWPSDADSRMQAIEFEFVAGYTADTIPACLKQAILIHVAAMFVNRGDCAGAAASASACSGCPIPPQAKATYHTSKIMDLRIGF